jgi:hypothetical protein
MENNYDEIRGNWWDRNWKWFVPSGCLGLLVLFVLFIGGIFLGVTSMFKESDAYKGAIATAQHHAVVMEKLGSPIVEDGFTSGNIHISGNTGNCDMQIPIKGAFGTGTIVVVAEKNGEWHYQQLYVEIKNSNEKIDLLKK